MTKSQALIYRYLRDSCREQYEAGDGQSIGSSTAEIAAALKLQRTNVSAVLNQLVKAGKVQKVKGKPMIYRVNPMDEAVEEVEVSGPALDFNTLIGSGKSLKKSIQQAKAAILYPPAGLHTLILGATGVGKTMFAELMYYFAIEKGVIGRESPFVSFNCADYASNPQLLMAHLFGSKKGAFTGADKDRAGLVQQAHGGILFLDEIHRLPPEGQEMLFVLIDKGVYTPLGDVAKKTSNVLIIGATTEDVKSSLLDTFTRRIPMTIDIPPLKDRTLEERFDLICHFFKTESERIGREILVSANTVRSLLLYGCPGNIGQLKSDIQLGCANAFLKFVSKGEKKIAVHSTDFPNHVRQGLVLYKQYSQRIDAIIHQDMKLSFNARVKKLYLEAGGQFQPDNFYESIEKRIQELKDRGVEEEDINFTMAFDIKNYFNKYIGKFEREVNKDELSKIVDPEIIAIIETFLKTASERLKRIFPTKIFYGLCLHVSAGIERLVHQKQILNHNLAEIIQKHREEYGLALSLANQLESKFQLKIPADEVGFIAMFLSVDEENEDVIACKPIVVVAMHGRSTATSMAEVANKLVGGDNVYGYDLNLDRSPKIAYNELKDLILGRHQGAGVILLVDMGSLGMFGELITEETGIPIRALDMVTTLLVIECARKALINDDIDQIAEEVRHSVSYLNNYSMSLTQSYIPSKDHIIITTCITGEGSAVKLKNMIEGRINLGEKDIQVVAISANDSKEMYRTIHKLSKDKKILAIVGTINPNVYNIPFIATSELFLDHDYSRLKAIVDQIKPPEDFYGEIFASLAGEMDGLDMGDFQPLCVAFIDTVKATITKELDIYKISGLIVHLACTVLRLAKGEVATACARKDRIKEAYAKEYRYLQEALVPLEDFYRVQFSEDELCYILMILLSI